MRALRARLDATAGTTGSILRRLPHLVPMSIHQATPFIILSRFLCPSSKSIIDKFNYMGYTVCVVPDY